jgi:hypothetical protein
VEQPKYHGGFDHPRRAFLLGVGLLVLLFGGFAVGIEAGTHPLEPTSAALPAAGGGVRTVTVQTPVVRTVIRGNTRVVRLEGSTRTQVVVIHDHGKTMFAYETPESAGNTVAGTPVTDSAPTVYTVAAETVTLPPVTVTETVPPVTVTVTEPASTDTTQSSTDSAGP